MVAVVAGPDAGHAFPALGLAARFAAAGDDAVVYTGTRWLADGARCGVDVRELPGLVALPGEDDEDAGAKLSARAARMALALAPELAEAGVDLVISDVITRAGGWAAELVGIPWIELSPHPLYEQSRGLPPIGAGMDVGIGVRGRLRDVALRVMSAPSAADGRRSTALARRSIGLSDVPEPAARFVATLPGLEVHRPDWPARTHVIGPLAYEPTDAVFATPDGGGPLVVVAPSTAKSGEADLGKAALDGLADLARRREIRVVYSALTPPPDNAATPDAFVAGTARQDEVLSRAAVAVCGAGHGMLAKALLAGVPVVTVPGGGDQWELANRVLRAGCGVVVRPADAGAIASAVARVLDDDAFAAAARGVAATNHATVDPVRVAHRTLDRASTTRERRTARASD
ncbi:glycosyl transferase [Gordonia sp. HY285]|uniref:glycosyltransferase n=1 Tax=Gordonia liuliyuniae TaxID=2911517 RepID=UPI001F191477|nr:nucleotide disphospho-sugar-binding domain-containing protein [Gordonia liuliyuniae]MCF8610833.1 glycosyl transferase [Gordonia liuliyuniae]